MYISIFFVKIKKKLYYKNIYWRKFTSKIKFLYLKKKHRDEYRCGLEMVLYN